MKELLSSLQKSLKTNCNYLKGINKSTLCKPQL